MSLVEAPHLFTAWTNVRLDVRSIGVWLTEEEEGRPATDSEADWRFRAAVPTRANATGVLEHIGASVRLELNAPSTHVCLLRLAVC